MAEVSKFLTYAVAGLLLALYITVSLYIERGREIAALQGEKSALLGKTSFLEAEIEKRNEKALAADKLKKENNKQIDKDKTGFNWDYDLRDNPVLLNFKRLHNKN